MEANETEQRAEKEVNPCPSSQLIFDKGTQDKGKGEKKVSSTILLGKLDSQMKNNEIESVFYHIENPTQKLIKDFNIKTPRRKQRKTP